MVEDFNEHEINIAKKLIDNRWKNGNVNIHLADIEYTKENEESPKPYPALVWEYKVTTFVILKIANLTYKSFFYYKNNKRFDTGVLEYNDLHECVMTIMKAQADFLLSMTAKKND